MMSMRCGAQKHDVHTLSHFTVVVHMGDKRSRKSPARLYTQSGSHALPCFHSYNFRENAQVGDVPHQNLLEGAQWGVQSTQAGETYPISLADRAHSRYCYCLKGTNLTAQLDGLLIASCGGPAPFKQGHPAAVQPYVQHDPSTSEARILQLMSKARGLTNSVWTRCLHLQRLILLRTILCNHLFHLRIFVHRHLQQTPQVRFE